MPRDLAHLSDEALVALVARSDEVALGELYDRFGRVAYGLARRILRDDALAEDAVQEGFLAAWRSAPRFVPERSKASTWLLTLVHRRAVDLVRREERRRAEALELAYYGGFTQSELAERLGQPVGTIKSRMFAGLARLRELLAERLGQPLGTIKSRMFTGLRRLRDVLADAGFDTPAPEL